MSVIHGRDTTAFVLVTHYACVRIMRMNICLCMLLFLVHLLSFFSFRSTRVRVWCVCFGMQASAKPSVQADQEMALSACDKYSGTKAKHVLGSGLAEQSREEGHRDR